MKIKDLCHCALFAALMAVCAWISVPLGSMTFTLQTFGVFLALLTLGGKRGTIAIFVYLCLGAVGLPVFSGFRGGMGMFFGATGGYLWGFLAAALLYWLLTAVFGAKGRIVSVILGLLLCYACGAGWMAFVMLDEWGSVSTAEVLTAFILPYLLPDGFKIFLAFLLSARLKRHIS